MKYHCFFTPVLNVLVMKIHDYANHLLVVYLISFKINLQAQHHGPFPTHTCIYETKDFTHFISRCFPACLEPLKHAVFKIHSNHLRVFPNTSAWQKCDVCRFILQLMSLLKSRVSISSDQAFLFILVRKSLDLIESLLRLAEVGQYEQVKQLFSFPIKHCPDMLVLALLQINTSWHTLRHELISTLMPIFLGNHPNSAIILHYAWHGQVRQVMSSSFQQ